ncbi:MAG: hypothetical protein GX200_01445 [Firmicutes bacterium]|nr:hypothetical protein [Bacillota bacterium]
MDNLVLSLEILAIGFAVVMATLYLLYLVLLLFGKAVARATSCRSDKNGETPRGVITEQTGGEPEEIIAAIAAAVSAFLGTAQQKFSLVSVKPQAGTAGSVWIETGRKNLLNKSRELALQRRGRRK